MRVGALVPGRWHVRAGGVAVLALAAVASTLLAGSAGRRAVAEEASAPVPVRVELTALGDADEVVALVEALGGEIEVRSQQRVQARVPADAVAALEAATALLRVERPALFVPLQAVATARSLLGIDRWQAAGFSGEGVKVAILDAGFRGYGNRLGGTLPDEVVARSFRPELDPDSVTDHGTLAAEVVHSIAPGAELYLVTFGTTTELSAAVDYLAAEQVEVVSFSLGFLHNGPGDGSGPVNAIVSRSTAAGAMWVVAAGNWARQHWSGQFLDADGDSLHEFGAGAEQNGRRFNAGDLIVVSLRWDDAWGAACSDYDLEVFGPSGTLVRASRSSQDCTSDPVEGLQVLATETGRYTVRIVNAGAERRHTLDLLVVGSPDRGEALDSSQPFSSLAEPADNRVVVTVGAIGSNAAPRVAPFSSRGPTLDGRAKPEVLSPTGGAQPGQVLFAGTSAAAPHVAGLAAMLKEAFPTLDAAGLRTEVMARAVPLSPAPPGGAPERLANLGSLSGLEPLLPPGAEAARFLGGQPGGAELALLVYAGPDGYPVRFVHLLSQRAPIAVFRFDVARQAFDRFILGAPERVQTLPVLLNAQPYIVRYAEPR